MCMMDYCDEMVTMIRYGAFRVARKLHKCSECYREILPAESYHAESFKFEGDFTEHKTCAHCMALRGWLSKECGGYVFGSIIEDFEEHAESHGWRFRRLASMARHKWVIGRPDRTQVLRSIPAMPPTTHDADAMIRARSAS